MTGKGANSQTKPDSGQKVRLYFTQSTNELIGSCVWLLTGCKLLVGALFSYNC